MIDGLTLLLAFTLGLFSTLHCVGMCGGVIGALACSVPRTIGNDAFLRNGYVLLFNLGRIAMYGVFGLVIGAGGAGLLERVDPIAWRRLASTIAGISLILIGIYLGGWLPTVRRIDLLGRGLWRRIQPLTRRLFPISNPGSALAAGLLWGWLPCGLVYYALLIAAPLGGASQGASFMLAFGMGTLPSMLTTGAFGGLLAQLTRSGQIRQGAAIGIVALGLAALLIAYSGLPNPWLPTTVGQEDLTGK